MSESFFRLNFNCVYTKGITEKELKLEIKNKEDVFRYRNNMKIL